MQIIQANLADAPAGDWQTVDLPLPSTSGTLRIQPVSRPAVIELREISLRSEEGGILWAARTLPELQAVPVDGSLAVLPSHSSSCLFFSFGFDPAWLLPPLDQSKVSTNLKIVFCIHKDLGAVSGALVAIYTQMDLMTAQVRTASTERNRIVREFQRQVQAAVEERDRTLNQWKEQADLLQRKLQAGRDALESELQALRAEREVLRAEREVLQQTILAWEQSRSWRLTRPLRSAAGFAQKLRKSFD